MTRLEYLRRVWLPEHGTWLALVSCILGVVAGPSVPGAAAQAQAWLCAALSWALFLAGLRALTWRRWREDDGEGEEGGGENVVPLRPRAPEGESKI